MHLLFQSLLPSPECLGGHFFSQVVLHFPIQCANGKHHATRISALDLLSRNRENESRANVSGLFRKMNSSCQSASEVVKHLEGEVVKPLRSRDQSSTSWLLRVPRSWPRQTRLMKDIFGDLTGLNGKILNVTRAFKELERSQRGNWWERVVRLTIILCLFLAGYVKILMS